MQLPLLSQLQHRLGISSSIDLTSLHIRGAKLPLSTDPVTQEIKLNLLSVYPSPGRKSFAATRKAQIFGAPF